MKNFRPLAMAAAVATASAGYAGVVNAQATYDVGNLGNLAIVPYYTVQEGYITGINVVNTTKSTQIVKIRFRRGSDSMDALDFNVIMSPDDIFNGYISGDDENNIAFRTNDKTCTAPILAIESGETRIAPMPNASNTPAASVTFEEGAMEGYVEIIAMGQPHPEHGANPAVEGSVDGEGSPIAINALHSKNGIIDNTGTPLDCDAVADNFFRNAKLVDGSVVTDSSTRGVLASDYTHQRPTGASSWVTGTTVPVENYYVESEEKALSVSYFIRDSNSGLEFGGRAVHIAGFGTEAMMSNQSPLNTGTYDPWGFFFPDLDGGSTEDTDRGRYDADDGVRAALAVKNIINTWGVGNDDRTIDSDWVMTLPGQYLMVNLTEYIADLEGGAPCVVNDCDFRDIPVQLGIDYFDREEAVVTVVQEEDELVLSPANVTPPPDEFLLLRNEVNVMRWDNTATEDTVGALASQYGGSGSFPVGEAATNGWASLSVQAGVNDPSVFSSYRPSVCEIDGDSPEDCDEVNNEAVPLVGFVAWKRSFDDALSNYGRIIDHSFILSSSGEERPNG